MLEEETNAKNDSTIDYYEKEIAGLKRDLERAIEHGTHDKQVALDQIRETYRIIGEQKDAEYTHKFEELEQKQTGTLGEIRSGLENDVEMKEKEVKTLEKMLKGQIETISTLEAEKR